MRAVVAGLIGGGVLVAILWWIGVGEPDPDVPAPLRGTSADEAPPVRASTATLEGRAGTADLAAGAMEATGTAVVRAQVVDVSGKPLAGVSVELRAVKRHDRFRWRPSKQAADAFKPPADLPRIDTRPSQPDGWVAFRGLDVRQGYQLRALPAAPLFGAQVTVWPGHTAAPPVLVLGEGVPLRVRVVDGAGTGTRAWVSAAVMQEPDHRGWNQLNAWSLPSTATGSDGRLALAAVPETTLMFSVFVPGVGSRQGLEVAPPFEEEVVLRFGHAGGPVIHGTVRDSGAQPIRGARLIATLNPQGANGWQARYTRVAQSGPDGAYRIAGLPAGSLMSLNAQATGYIYVHSAAPMLDLTEGQEVAVDVTLYRGGVLEGTVRDSGGKAIPAARVVASLPGQHYWNNRGTTAVSDEAGRFRIEDVPLGKGQLGAYADGFYMDVPEGVKVRNWQAPPGPLYEVKEEGERLTCDIVLATGVRLEGTVVDESDAPVAGARIWAQSNLQQRLQAFDQYATQRQTDGEGRFVYLGLPPGEVWRFTANTSEGRAKQVSVTLAPDTLPDPIRLVLKRRGGLRGRLDAGTRGLTRPMAVTIRRKQGGSSYTVSTRADGGFEQRNMAAGAYDVYASDGLGRRIGTAVSVEVVDGNMTDGITIAVEALQHVMGRVMDMDGEPVSGIQVKLHYKNAGGGNQTNNTNTRLDGRFAWRDLLDGDYEVQIADDKTRYGVRPGEDEQKYLYVVPPREIVEGSVLAPDGRPVAGGYVNIRRVRKPGNWNGANAQIVNGRFRGEAPRGEGQIDIAVDQAQDVFGRRLNTLPYLYEAWTITTGPLEIKLERGFKITGRVLDTSGKGVPHIGVHVQPERRDGRKWNGYYRNYNTSLRTDADGRFEQLALREGRYEVYAQAGEAWMQPEPVVAESGSENVIVRLERGLTIEGRVVDGEGAGVPAVPIQYTWALQDGRNRKRNVSRSAKTDGTGAFRVTGLPPDAVGRLNASPASGGEKSYIRNGLADVAAGETGVLITLESGGYFEGRVQGPSGEALGRMRVRADTHNGQRWVQRHSTRTKNDGTFRIGPVPAALYRLRVDARGEYSAAEPLEMRGPASDVVLEVPRGQPVKGRVLGENLKGMKALWLYRTANGGWASKSASVQTNGSFLVNQPTDVAGTLLIRRNNDDRYALLEDVRPSDGPFEVELEIGPSIAGYVTGLPETWRYGNIYARTGTGLSLWGSLGRDGAFVIRGVPAGTYTLSGSIRPGRIEPKRDVPCGASDVALEYSR